ncbi:hypothetical protein L7F22_030724 [Adiantum nelumboides]|nr:hypothetical protein [Adiantum nelumboides]
MDAGYLRDTLGQVVARGCAETISVAPLDPIHYLSLWLLKYVENAKLVDELQKERELLSHLQVAKQDKQRQADSRKQERIHKQDTTVSFLKSIQTDPYLLFDECLKAILEFTGGTSAYIALVLDNPWEPPKKQPESADGEGVPSDEDAEEEEKEEETSGELDPEIAEQGSEGDDVGNEGDDKKGGEEVSENSGGELKKKFKLIKPPNYRKKVLLYVAASPNNDFLLNKMLDRKTGPISFSVLLQALTKLHVANVLYQEVVVDLEMEKILTLVLMRAAILMSQARFAVFAEELCSMVEKRGARDGDWWRGADSLSRSDEIRLSRGRWLEIGEGR